MLFIWNQIQSKTATVPNALAMFYAKQKLLFFAWGKKIMKINESVHIVFTENFASKSTNPESHIVWWDVRSNFPPYLSLLSPIILCGIELRRFFSD